MIGNRALATMRCENGPQELINVSALPDARRTPRLRSLLSENADPVKRKRLSDGISTVRFAHAENSSTRIAVQDLYSECCMVFRDRFVRLPCLINRDC